jgi:prepilin-type N-terminal cleavage/methylation domain-containing protein
MKPAHMTTAARRRPRAFTLIEMSIVVLIIGILMAFVLAAGAAGLESARVKATQALLSKLNTGLEERLDAVLQTQVTPNGAHQFLAAIPLTNLGLTTAQANFLAWGIAGEQRAQVIARLDQIRAEFPDVFFIDHAGINGPYPIKFGGLPYPIGSTSAGATILPLGNDPTSTNPYIYGVYGPSGNAYNGPYGYIPPGTTDNTLPNPILFPASNPAGTGINGASYAAAASLFKLAGYTPRGCDGVDNNNDGFVDDVTEGTQDPSGNPDAEAQAKVTLFLQNHQHKTARAEMLYALLVEGLGPLGNVFDASDFRNTEVRDTDNDGAPEFVDGWGEPIQFFRWPFWHRTNQEISGNLVTGFQLAGFQKGDATYGPTEVRQQNPLDPNGQLVSVAWWGDNAGNSPMTPSVQMQVLQQYFGPLIDPLANSASGSGAALLWDRSGTTARRAYLTKFLLVSSGPDQIPGVPMLTDSAIRTTSALTISQAITGVVTYSNGWSITPGEGWAMLLDPTDPHIPAWWDKSNTPPVGVDYSLDDITNQGLQNRSGGIQ